MLLNLNPEVVSKSLTHTALARSLQSEPEIVRGLIYGEFCGWRSSAIGAAIAILQDQPDFEKDIADRIIRGSWIAPQLAASFAIISRGDSVLSLENFLDTAQVTPRPESLLVNPKGYLSAYAALKLMGKQSAIEFRASSTFDEIYQMDQIGCIYKTEVWFNTWKDVPPI